MNWIFFVPFVVRALGFFSLHFPHKTPQKACDPGYIIPSPFVVKMKDVLRPVWATLLI